jgi:hypothetical protein
MKSLADIAGLNKVPPQKMGYNYTFNLNPDALSMMGDMLSGKEPEGLIKPVPYVIPQPTNPSTVNPQQLVSQNTPTVNTEEDKSPIGLTGKDFEKWIRAAGDDGISTYFSTIYNKRKASGEKITEEDFKGVKQQVLDYINSPLYAERQANLPDDYGMSRKARKNPDAEQFLMQFNQQGLDWKKNKRIELLKEVGIKLDDPDKRTGHYLPSQLPSNIEISTPYTRAVIAHELGHAMHDYKAPLTDEQKAYMKENKGALPTDMQIGYESDASDPYNAQNFYESIYEPKKGSGAPLANPKLNIAEVDMFQKLAKPLLLTSDKMKYKDEDPSKHMSDPVNREIRKYNEKVDEYKNKMQKMYSKDTHQDKDNSNKFDFADEMYGDLQGVRQLLLDAGITKSFGEALDKDKMDKAILDKNVTDDPAFRRFYFRYGKDNIIKLNNTIAQQREAENKGQSLLDIANA